MVLAALELNNFSPWGELLQTNGALMGFFKQDTAVRELSHLSDHPLILPIHVICISQVAINMKDVDRH